MRKTAFIAVWIVFLSVLSFGADRFFVSAGAAGVFPVDSGYRDFYGTLQLSPELKAGYSFFKRFYVWLGYSFFASSYTEPDLLEKANGSQHFLALGAGWETRRSRRLQFDFFAALIVAAFREKALGETVKDSAPGLHLGAGARYFVSGKIFVGAAVSFSNARVTVVESENTVGGLRLLGGVRLAANLGLRF
jgi:TM2 domain-containing membrane protein YozV